MLNVVDFAILKLFLFLVRRGWWKIKKRSWKCEKKIIKDEKGENFYDFLPVSNVRFIWNSIFWRKKGKKFQFKIFAWDCKNFNKKRWHCESLKCSCVYLKLFCNFQLIHIKCYFPVWLIWLQICVHKMIKYQDFI